MERFMIKIPRETLDDLKERLSRTRWPDEVEGAGWDYGANLQYMKELLTYWHHGYTWRTEEEALNRFTRFRSLVDCTGIHFIHTLGRSEDPLPLLLLHGWPASSVQMVKIIPLLSDPGAHGGDPADAFDVVAPDLPGYGFSDRPGEKGMNIRKIADLFVRLMTDELGYDKFAIRASDLGAGVAWQIGLTHPELLAGIHLSGAIPPSGELPSDLTGAEQKFLADYQRYRAGEMAYAMVQATKPQTLAYGLTDSPAGLAAWIVEKFRAWSDCGGDIETRFTKDELLTNLTIYWATGTIHSSCRPYYESMHSPWPGAGGKVAVPTGVAMFPKDMVPCPPEWMKRWFNLQHWTEMPRGGHFGELEEPELLAVDIREFFRPFRK